MTGATDEEHLANLTHRLQSAGMRLKREKCAFLLKSVSYLGHVISSEGLHTAEDKVVAIVDAPDLRNLTQLRSFLGMVNYYGKFLHNLAATLSPLYHLLKQTTAWHWGPKQKEASQSVKDMLKSNRVLTHFNDQLPLILECDASPYGLGAVLSHEMPVRLSDLSASHPEHSPRPSRIIHTWIRRLPRSYLASKSIINTCLDVTSSSGPTTSHSLTFSTHLGKYHPWLLGGRLCWAHMITTFCTDRDPPTPTQMR